MRTVDPQTTPAKSLYPLVGHCPCRARWCTRARVGTSVSPLFHTAECVARDRSDEAVQGAHPQFRDTAECDKCCHN